jgi:hypothetical protein
MQRAIARGSVRLQASNPMWGNKAGKYPWTPPRERHVRLAMTRGAVDRHLKALVTQFTVQALHERVLYRLARPAEPMSCAWAREKEALGAGVVSRDNVLALTGAITRYPPL